MPGRFTLVLCSVVTLGSISPLWGQIVTPDSKAPPPITLAEQKVLGGFYNEFVKHEGMRKVMKEALAADE